MEWYYAVGDKQTGPVSDEEFKRLAAEGTIRPDTLVWRAGQDNWKPYREVIAAAAGTAAQPPLTMAAGAEAQPGGAPAAGSVVCRECGRIFPPEDVVKFGDAFVCAACKPVYVQRMREGGRNPGEMEYAGFWIRFAARFIDGIILWVVNTVISLALGFGIMQTGPFVPGQPPPPEFWVAYFIMLAVNLGTALAYETILTGRYGATVGKMACKLKVVTAEGERITYLRSFARYLSTIISAMPCGIGYIIAAFDDQKRALHDHICNTRVVRN